VNEPLDVTADYRQTPLGTWQVDVVVNRAQFETVSGGSLEEAYGQVLDAFDRASRRHGGAMCLSVHTLDGDAAAFAALAEERGLRVPEDRGVGATFYEET